jgi:hypothetical protein
MDLMLIDGFILKERYDDALAAIDRLDNDLSGDPYLDTLRANICTAKETRRTQIGSRGVPSSGAGTRDVCRAVGTRYEVRGTSENRGRVLLVPRPSYLVPRHRAATIRATAASGSSPDGRRGVTRATRVPSRMRARTAAALHRCDSCSRVRPRASRSSPRGGSGDPRRLRRDLLGRAVLA